MTTKKNIFWSFGDTFSQLIFNFLIGIWIARILSPHDIGNFAILSILLVLPIVFLDSGFTLAIINKDCDNVTLSSIFWLNLIYAIFIYSIVFLISPYISEFYKQSITLELRIYGLLILLISVSRVSYSLLMKRMNFKGITLYSLLCSFFLGILAIIMAYKGFGIWALIFRALVFQLCLAIIFLKVARWTPLFKFSFYKIKKLTKFSLNTYFSNFLNKIFDVLFPLFIGKLFSISTLGLFERANQFKKIVANSLTEIIKKVQFSELSAIKNEKLAKEKFNNFFNLTFFLSSLCFVGGVIFSRDIIYILLGEKWIESAKFLKVLSVSGFFIPIYAININYLLARNYSRLMLKIELINKILIIPTILLGCFFNIQIVIWGIVFVSIISYFISWHYLRRYGVEQSITKIIFILCSIILLMATDDYINNSQYIFELLFNVIRYFIFLMFFVFIFYKKYFFDFYRVFKYKLRLFK